MTTEAKRLYDKARYQENKAAIIVRTSHYAEAHPEKHRGYAKAYRQRNPDKVFAKRLRERFNISVQRFKEMLFAQDNRCAICKAVFTSTPHIDHDHACCPGNISCGQCVRGLLCKACNTALGNMQDDVERMYSAIAYLERFYGRTQSRGKIPLSQSDVSSSRGRITQTSEHS